jgi:hypothetical protein
MINSYIIQEFTKRSSSMKGISIKRNSGTIRFVQYALEKDNIIVSQDDIIESINYMISRNWIVKSGVYGDEQLYSVLDDMKL